MWEDASATATTERRESFRIRENYELRKGLLSSILFAASNRLTILNQLPIQLLIANCWFEFLFIRPNSTIERPQSMWLNEMERSINISNAYLNTWTHQTHNNKGAHCFQSYETHTALVKEILLQDYFLSKFEKNTEKPRFQANFYVVKALVNCYNGSKAHFKSSL